MLLCKFTHITNIKPLNGNDNVVMHMLKRDRGTSQKRLFPKLAGTPPFR